MTAYWRRPLGNGSGFESLAAHHVLAKTVALE